ncbi:MAG: roadblock/LC7 domain-containing protein [Gemmatimonadota bacterium]|nr:roadblock/LC7 domain-containing protein [Gemmatimonadota bacterium]
MANIQDVVTALAQHQGVETAIVLGRDGLPIASRANNNGADIDGVAALVPSVVDACRKLGVASNRGDFNASVLDFGTGTAVVSSISNDSLLLVLVQAGTNVGALLHDIGRYRAAIAGLL